jgi:hypothetical protein
VLHSLKFDSIQQQQHSHWQQQLWHRQQRQLKVSSGSEGVIMSSDNKLDFIQGVNLQPWEWHNLGAVFGSSKENNQCVAARCNFVVRKGFDEVEQTQYGNVLEGLGDVGFNLRAKQYAFHVSASNLSYKQGVVPSSSVCEQCRRPGDWNVP